MSSRIVLGLPVISIVRRTHDALNGDRDSFLWGIVTVSGREVDFDFRKRCCIQEKGVTPFIFYVTKPFLELL